MAEILYDEQGTAAYLGGDDSPLSVRTVQRLRCEGTGPAYLKIGRLIRYRQTALDVWLAQRERRSTSGVAA